MSELLAREAASLVARLRLWTPARWAAAAAGGRTRADLVHHLAQGLADAAAATAGDAPARLRLWTPARWAAAGPGGGTRADLVHHLAQCLADAAAAASGDAPARLPRLDSDLVLPDQLAVTADDLGRARPADAVAGDAAAHLLVHRAELLDEPVPAGLLVALDAPDEQALRARAACTSG